jgi:hypothetical protein
MTVFTKARRNLYSIQLLFLPSGPFATIAVYARRACLSFLD